MTTSVASPARTTTRARRWSEIALLLIGALGLIGFVYPTLVLPDYLPRVDPSTLGHGITYAGSAIDRTWITQALISALVLILVTGLPINGPSGRGSLPGAVAQAIGGVAVTFWTLAGTAFANLFYFSGPDDYCTYASCWPYHEQTVADLVPGALTGIAMFLMTLLVNRLAWWIRTLVPIAVWVVRTWPQRATERVPERTGLLQPVPSCTG